MAGPTRARSAALVLGLAAAALAGCVAIPTSGPIATGSPAPVDESPPIPLAALPQQDDTPEGIVAGFFSAARAGVFDDFDVAREFLTRNADAAWDPRERLLVAASDPELSMDGDMVVAVVDLAGSVDSEGVFQEAAPGSEVTLSFGMQRNHANQWRIADLQNGIVIRDSAFDASFSPVPVYFATPDWQIAVPEVRWLPDQSALRRAVLALFDGPAPWLADGVANAAPPLGAPVEVADPGADGVVTIDLPAEAFQESWADEQRGHLQAQLEATLFTGRLRGAVSSVGLTVASSNGPVPLPVQPDEVPTLLTDPQPRSGPYAVVDGVIADVSGELAEPVADLPAVTDLAAPNHPAVSADGTLWVLLDGTRRLVLLPAGGAEPETLLEGADLLPPSVDRFGWVWTGEKDSAGLLTAVLPDGTTVPVNAPLLADRQLRSMRVSRDGARIAIASVDADGRSTIHVASIVRAADEAGEPRALGDGALTVGASLTDVTELAWSTEQALAVLGTAAGSEQRAVYLATVGGRTTLQQVVAEGTVGLAAARGNDGIYVVDTDGVLRLLRGSSWVETTSGVVDPVFPG
ncbi:LpqB family beta-propeller domain-containing protein [Actinotalea fermentans]|uniref:Lipoprotein LpqB n=1 Tax=Actinotalea fermentans TaxID=43671 RepID=A0A511YSY2_9CELL|nr:LpqB family beta-propeller domain-containing protein [Actinotalea fermentans]KGM15655.1 hypothetical protein N867_06640 [Actinotalea fermentans ATCC 43279 = JCM 9966 = DSM 3133]GEN78311.1 lipoprotein LpqB [Actinotalea fermentans]